MLSTAATLEAEIERLHRLRVCPTERRHRSRTRWELERKKRWHQVSFTTLLTSGQSAKPDPPQGKTGSGSKDSDLGDPPKLKAEVASFLQGSSEMSGEEDPPLEPPTSQPADWVRWRAEECNLPTWWRELTAVWGEDMKTLARQVRASFQFPWHRHELDPMEAPYHAPPAPPCLCRWRFMPPGGSTFASQDIREIPREITVAYALALQYYVERSNLPRRSQPRLLAESVLELREEVGFYLSFQDREVFQGLDLPQEEGDGSPAITITEILDIADVPEASPALKTISKYPGWETVLHSSRLVCTAGETPPPTPVPRPRRRTQVPSHTTPVACPSCPSKAPLPPTSSPPPWALALTKPSTPPRGFTGVTSCLRAPEFEETGQEVFENTTSIGLVATPGISSICATRVVKDDETGLVYMDTVSTLVGKLSSAQIPSVPMTDLLLKISPSNLKISYPITSQ